MRTTNVFVSLFLVNLLRGVSGCELNCAQKPFFTPSKLVVKHRDPISATCSLCPHCQDNSFNLEFSVGKKVINGTTILWTVDKMEEWSTSALCYYYAIDTQKQCCTLLPVLVYKPPDNVSVSIKDNTGPVLDGHEYTLQCEVQNVAPVQRAHVTFYDGIQQLGETQVKNSSQLRPETEIYSLKTYAKKEKVQMQYWCNVVMDLGPEGPKAAPMRMSQKMTAIVHYGPQRQGQSHSDLITITAGNPLFLNCTAEGNPQPIYEWTVLPKGIPAPKSSIITIGSAASEHGGYYRCSVTNYLGTLTVDYIVEVKPNLLPYLAILIIVLPLVIAGLIYCYRQNRCGNYTLSRPSCLQRSHLPVPNSPSNC